MTRAPTLYWPARLWTVLLALLVLGACTRAPVASVPLAERTEIAARLTADIAVLASDDFGGREPGTPGEERTLEYLEQRMGEIGLVSGTGDPGSYWRLPVDLVISRAQSSRVTLTAGRRSLIVPEEEAAAFTPRRRALATSGPGTGVPVMFVGRAGGEGSAAAPVSEESVAGALVILLPDAGGGADRRAALFAKRAVAVMTVVPDAAAIAAVRAERETGRLQLASEEVDTLTAFVTEAAMERALGERGWKALRQRAARRDHAPEELAMTITIEATSDRREFTTHNLLGMIPGAVPGSGAVLLLGHWDHLGECGPPDAIDRICNGARDNASGIAAMLELARRLKAGGPHDRDIYVLATGAEEAGLLGARAFAERPPVPLADIVAAFNFDMVALAPAGSPLGFVGRGRTPLDAVVAEVAAEAGRGFGDRALADSFVQRQDGWALLQKGVPAVLLSSTYGSRAVLQPFLDGAYHRPGDKADDLELGGAIDDLLLHEALVARVADAERYRP